jgi:hypothetical protein
MSKRESIFIGLVVGIACPLLMFVAGWWAAVAFHLYIFPLPTGLIVAVALAGLGLGLVFDALYLQRLVRNFFTASLRFMAPVHLGLSVVAVGIFMGVPVGTFSLGVAAGIYMGRRERHREADARDAIQTAEPECGHVCSVHPCTMKLLNVRSIVSLCKRANRAFHRAAVFAAFVTSGAALPIGLLALQSEKQILRPLEAVLGLDPNRLEGAGGLLLVAFLCLVLFGAQYVATRAAGRLAFRIRGDDSRQLISSNG